MFIGEYHHNLDEKGRVAVPAKFRDDLNKGLVITRGLADNCLFLYTMEEWTKLAEKLSQLPFANAKARAFSRLMLAGAMDCQLDKQGRVILPDYLRRYAKIEKKVVLAGLFNRVEIWDEDAWNTYSAENENSSDDIEGALNNLAV